MENDELDYSKKTCILGIGRTIPDVFNDVARNFGDR